MPDDDRLQRLAPYVWAEIGEMAESAEEVAWLTERVRAGDFQCVERPGNVLEVLIGFDDPPRGPWQLITSSDPDEHFDNVAELLDLDG